MFLEKILQTILNNKNENQNISIRPTLKSVGFLLICKYSVDECISLTNYFKKCTPKEAKIKGNQLILRPDWEDVKVDIMLFALRCKFNWKNNPILCKRLINTGLKELVEVNYWGDTFWGYDRNLNRGKNILGRLLMLIREELKQNMPDNYFRELEVNKNLGVSSFIIPEQFKDIKK